jgi:hypothetical protein
MSWRLPSEIKKVAAKLKSFAAFLKGIQMNQKKIREAYALIFLTFCIWGSIYIAGKIASETIPSYLIAMLRSILSLIPLWIMSVGHMPFQVEKEDMKYFVLIGFLGYFLCIQAVQLGIQLTGASMASLLNSMTPIVVTVCSAVFLKEKVTATKMVCLVLAVMGTVIITKGTNSRAELGGVLAVLISVMSFGMASVLMRRVAVKYPPVVITAIAMTISVIFHLPIGIWSALTMPVIITSKAVWALLFLGFVGSGVSQATWTKALSILPASTCSLFYPFQPLLSAFLGFLILKETFQLHFCIGLILISLDVVLNTLEAKKQAGKI